MDVLQKNFMHIATEHWMALIIIVAMAIALIIAFRVMLLMDKKRKDLEKEIVLLAREKREAVEKNCESVDLIAELKKNVRDLEEAVKKGVKSALTELGHIIPHAPENSQETDADTAPEDVENDEGDEAVSADVGLTAAEEAEIEADELPDASVDHRSAADEGDKAGDGHHER